MYGGVGVLPPTPATAEQPSCWLLYGNRPAPPPGTKPPYVIHNPISAAVRGSARVTTPPRGSDRVRSTDIRCSFRKEFLRVLCAHAKGGIRPRGLSGGGGVDLLRYPAR